MWDAQRRERATPTRQKAVKGELRKRIFQQCLLFVISIFLAWLGGSLLFFAPRTFDPNSSYTTTTTTYSPGKNVNTSIKSGAKLNGEQLAVPAMLWFGGVGAACISLCYLIRSVYMVVSVKPVDIVNGKIVFLDAPIHGKCPHCKATLIFEAHEIGHTVDCPACRINFGTIGNLVGK